MEEKPQTKASSRERSNGLIASKSKMPFNSSDVEASGGEVFVQDHFTVVEFYGLIVTDQNAIGASLGTGFPESRRF